MSIHLTLWKQVLVLGVAEAGLYALLPIALVLSYRVSRTIAFVHGGIAASAALLYWWFVFNIETVPGTRPELPPFVGLLVVVAIGALLGAAYGLATTHPKVAALPRMTLTVISLGAMMTALGVFSTTLAVPPDSIPPSPFNFGRITIAGVVLTPLRTGTIVIAVVLVVALAVFLNMSRTGRHLQAIADDPEPASWCGVKVGRITTGIHTGAGAVSALAGALIAAQSGPDPINLIIFLLRGLAVAIVGGLMSLPIALIASFVLALVQTGLVVGVIGTSAGASFDIGRQELLLNLILLVMILGVARLRPQQFYLLDRQSL
ncbi:MAG TPA: branched-chain amino acid ABC transporter permease [Sporichthyaceae bacterium]|jgi:branched-subunit amino acid ABC-type transport system permease component|nr:branched-chain amino acid ABC transporter permease [Sporichthyaceae bacterium]